MDSRQDRRIAIVGVALRLPGECDTLEAFWAKVSTGEWVASSWIDKRWGRAWHGDPSFEHGVVNVDNAALLDRIDSFDQEFFGIPKEQASCMPPEYRLMLQLAVDALDDAGMPMHAVAGTHLGVFCGVGLPDYVQMFDAGHEPENPGPFIHEAGLFMAPNRISYALDARGPSVVVDSACATSALAVHLACQSLLAGECDAALVTAAQLYYSPASSASFSQLGTMSKDGRCRPFDETARGYGRGEGVLAVVLKPLERARADGDRIHAVIRATATCHGGKNPKGFTQPRSEQQAVLIQQALATAGVAHDDVDYFEAHGTGTVVGDYQELTALGSVFENRRRRPLPVGSVKACFNHGEAAAGLTGILKAVSIVKQRMIPPTPIVVRPREDVSFSELNIALPQTLEPIAATERPACVGVNSFGIGGSYVTTIVEEYREPPRAAETPPATARAQLIPISVNHRSCLDEYRHDLAALAASTNESLRDLAHTLSLRRTSREWRTYAVAATGPELVEQLASLPPLVRRPASPPTVGFVFTGMGPQWWGMGQDVMATEPVFRAAIAAFDDVWLGTGGGWSVVDEMHRDATTSRIAEQERASVVNAAVQVALARQLAHWGVRPAAIVGHSVGELAAAHVAGCLSLEQLAPLLKARASWTNMAEGLGTMLAVGASGERLAEVLRDHPDVDVAARNSPAMTTVAGHRDAIDALRAALDKLEIFAQPLRVTVPYHSRFLRDRRADFASAPDLGVTSPPVVPYFSATKGTRYDGPFDGAYWMDNVCHTVLFQDAVAQMSSVDVFLEIGPHPVLKSSLSETLGGRSILVLESLHREKSGPATLLQASGKLFQLGVELDWDALVPAPRRFVDVPSVPWRSQTIGREGRVARLVRERKNVHPLLGRAESGDGTTVYQTHVSVRRFPFLREHLLNNMAVFPASLFVTMIRRVAEDLLDTPRVEISNARFLRPLFPDEERPTPVRTTLNELDRTVTIQSAADREATEWITHVVAEIGTAGDVQDPPGLDVPSSELADKATSEIYPVIPGLRMDGHFVVLSNVWRSERHAQANLADTGNQPDWFREAMLVELAMQALWQTDPVRYHGTLGLPASFRRLTFCGDPGGRIMARAVRRDAGFQLAALGDVVVSGRGRAPILVLEGYERRVTGYGDQIPWRAADSCFGEQLASVKSTATPEPAREVVIGAELASVLDAVRRRSNDKLDLVLPVDATSWDPSADLTQVCWTTFDVLRKLARIVDDQEGDVRVFLHVDHGGAGGGGRALAHHVLVALSRVFRNECPQLPVHVVQCAASALADELRIEDTEREVVWTDTGRHAVRVVKDAELAAAPLADTTRDARSFAYSLGPVDGARREFGWFEHVRRPLESREVRVRVLHASLNFRDILKLDGGYPTDDASDSSAMDLGDECMGIVLEVGRDAPQLHEGQRVIVNARGALASEVVVDAAMAWPVPDGIDDVAAACIPAVFGTAWYALRDVANLQPGERVLIHSGAGGVGLAAIQIAKLCGADIYATAGTAAKRELLNTLGVQHVYDSKSLHFKDDIVRDTRGELLDVVLNSLAGPALIASMKLLRRFGRFVEIGRRDLYANTHVGIHPLRNNVSFVAVDMGDVWRYRPDRARAMMCEILAAFATKALCPLPVHSFDVDRVGDAFAALGDRDRAGKVCVQLATPNRLSTRPGRTRGYRQRVSSAGTYLVTGGFGAIGAAVLGWLANAGAKAIAVVSRSGRNHAAFPALERELRAAGVDLRVHDGSAADAAVLKAAIDDAAASGRPVRGVVHLAGVLRDRRVDELTRRDFQEVLASKIAGAWNLHRLLGKQRLDLFVMFSSISVLHGTPGQSAYCMANAFMDWLACHRRRLGLAAQSLGWGPFLGGGMAVDAAVQRLFEQQGFAGVTEAETRELLDTWIPVELPHVYVRRGDWQRFLDGLPDVPPLYDKMASGHNADAAEMIFDKLRGAVPDDRRAILADYLVATIATAIGRDLSGIQDAQWLGDNVGIDSLATIGLTTRLSYELGVRASQRDLARGTTFGELVDRMLQRVNASLSRKSDTQATPGARARSATATRMPLLPAHPRWLAWMFKPDGFSRQHCGVPTYFELPSSVDDEQIETIVHKLVSRHEALRTRFQHDGVRWIQSLRKHADVTIHRRTAQPGQNPLDAAGSLILEPWNVTTEPLLRCAVVTNTEEKTRALVLSINHLVCDHIGLNPLLGDVRTMLSQTVRGMDVVLPEIETTYSAWCELVHDKMTAASRDLPDDWRAVWAAGKASLGSGRRADGVVRMHAKPTLAAFVHAAAKVIGRSLHDVAMIDLITVGRPRDFDLDHTVGMMTLDTRFHRAESIPLDLDFDDCIRRFCAVDALEADARAVLGSRTFRLNAYAAPHDPKEVKLFDDTHDFLRREDRKVLDRLGDDAPTVHPYAADVTLQLTSTGFRWFLHSYLPGLPERAAALFADIEAESLR